MSCVEGAKPSGRGEARAAREPLFFVVPLLSLLSLLPILLLLLLPLPLFFRILVWSCVGLPPEEWSRCGSYEPERLSTLRHGEAWGEAQMGMDGYNASSSQAWPGGYER